MLKPQPIPEIPAETVRVVGAAFPKGNLYIHLRDILGTVYQDELFADLYPVVDAGYIDAEALVTNQTRYQLDLVGPTAKDYRWQAREQNGYALSNFSIDWEHKQAQCPQGQISSSWTPSLPAQSGDYQNQVWLCHLWTLPRAFSMHQIKTTDPLRKAT